jgi:hypothetical protein
LIGLVWMRIINMVKDDLIMRHSLIIYVAFLAYLRYFIMNIIGVVSYKLEKYKKKRFFSSKQKKNRLAAVGATVLKDVGQR